MKLKLMAVSCALMIAGLLGVTISESSFAVTCPAGSLREGDKDVTSLAECNIPKQEGDTLPKRAVTILNVVVGIIGIVTVAVVVYGGIQLVTSVGDSAKITKAKNTILYGIVGLIVCLLAFAIVNFVLTNVFNESGSSTTKKTETKSSETTEKSSIDSGTVHKPKAGDGSGDRDETR